MTKRKNRKDSKELRRARTPGEKRLAFIDFRLAFAGSLRRSMLADEFGISPQQATKDIKQYIRIASNNLDYSLPKKAYIASDNFRPTFKSTRAGTFLRRLALVAGGGKRYRNWIGIDAPLELSRAPERNVPSKRLSLILKALQQDRFLEARYVSLRTGDESTRKLLITALASDGYRWHARAWDQNKEQYSDFVLSRLSHVKLRGVAEGIRPKDAAWSENCEVHLIPKKGIPERSRQVIAKEFAMTDGVLVVKSTKAMLFYTLRGYGFNPRKKDDGGLLVNESLLPIEIDNIADVEKSLHRRT